MVWVYGLSYWFDLCLPLAGNHKLTYVTFIDVNWVSKMSVKYTWWTYLTPPYLQFVIYATLGAVPSGHCPHHLGLKSILWKLLGQLCKRKCYRTDLDNIMMWPAETKSETAGPFSGKILVSKTTIPSRCNTIWAFIRSVTKHQWSVILINFRSPSECKNKDGLWFLLML